MDLGTQGVPGGQSIKFQPGGLFFCEKKYISSVGRFDVHPNTFGGGLLGGKIFTTWAVWVGVSPL